MITKEFRELAADAGAWVVMDGDLTIGEMVAAQKEMRRLVAAEDARLAKQAGVAA